MPMTPKQMIRLLEQNGFVLVSANGSHYKLSLIHISEPTRH